MALEGFFVALMSSQVLATRNQRRENANLVQLVPQGRLDAVDFAKPLLRTSVGCDVTCTCCDVTRIKRGVPKIRCDVPWIRRDMTRIRRDVTCMRCDVTRTSIETSKRQEKRR